ncbi:trans-L-3-hydroxyproline dehydratase-like isoform X2 [Pomacea canaliculata]|uniref:trans-L-3-hydroxyproline dehydratase-like isoform X2 n=1 Tax=Pomacea canaliculata TaxID=400727 RepID=UPI000D7284E3|nr:trans-L-3-hydroxyproline dehydratase-like isoform X2 [Pomacea canaliculata]
MEYIQPLLKMAEIPAIPFLPPQVEIKTTEMHTGGEPLRIIESGFPEAEGRTLLEKRAWLRQRADHYRKFLMFEPRGHCDMYGALLTTPDLPGVDVGVIFMHNEGYSTMCGHGVIALGRYIVDRKLVTPVSPETEVVIQCPCGPVKARVEYNFNQSGRVSFESVPSYVFALDVTLPVPGVGDVTVDVSYGGAFYVFVPASRLNLDLNVTAIATLADAAQAVTDAAKTHLNLLHPHSQDLAFVYGTILTDDYTQSVDGPATNLCVFANKQVDRSPCGSGCSARVALEYRRGIISLGQKLYFRSAVTGSVFATIAVREVEVKQAGPQDSDVVGVVTEVSGNAYYSGQSTFCVEQDDPLTPGFLPR